jgi:hypothetical protein
VDTPSCFIAPVKNPEVVMLSLQSSIQASGQQVGSQLGDELVLLDAPSGIYFGLNPVGARVWSLVQEPTTAARVRDVLTSEFEVDPQQCERDVLRVLDQLALHRLITVSG